MTDHAITITIIAVELAAIFGSLAYLVAGALGLHDFGRQREESDDD